MLELIPMSKSLPKDEILKNIKYTNNDFVFASGSLIQGIGNNKSDLDLFVVTESIDSLKGEQSIEYDNNYFMISFARIDGIDCDIEYWSLYVVEELLDQLESIDFNDTNKRSLHQLNVRGGDFNSITSFLHRFITSTAIYNHDLYNSYKNKVNLKNYYRLMTRWYVNLVDNAYDDIIGNFEKGEYAASLIIAKNTLIKALCAYVFSHNHSLDREKWAYINLKFIAEKNREAADIINKFNKIYFFCNARNENELNNLVEDYIFFINRIIRLAGNNIGGL
ncbi:hypothetical protein ABD76_09390 [Paenibacillus dendritiformis]|uniref:hypothetical protein n=1 Tax=Paenibacillus dendritiformis TaxID=130049 RepID=UPI0018CF7CC1|nr:hypothetical protein [Paenibacillus dendritiformis]MBG9792694.1 hypothetical protein [Paenibacillus dendritiformis]